MAIDRVLLNHSTTPDAATVEIRRIELGRQNNVPTSMM